MSQAIYDFSAKSNKGKEVSLSDYKGKVLLVVNTASKCGFTPQYQGLEELHQQYGAKGFEVLAFPCNQFGNQEPGTDSDIAQFCDLNYHTSYPLFSKVEVNGDGTHPLWKFLKKSAPGLLGTEAVKWNFTKFLINKKGVPVKRYAPQDSPKSLSGDIEALLAE